jgi:hypothetical protein
MTLQPILQPYIDSTMLTCFRSCPRKFYHEFVLGLRPPGLSIDLHAGACFATACEVFRKSFYGEGHDFTASMQRALAAFEIAWGDFEIPEFKKTAKTKDNMWKAVEEYFAKFPPLTDHVQPFYTAGKPTFEFTFAIPLEPAMHPSGNYDVVHNLDHFPLHPFGEPFLYSGRFDMLGKFDGRPCVVDDKTSGRSISTGWSDQWNLRNQFIGYTWACQQVGIPLDTVVPRGITVLKTKIDFAEAIKTYSDLLRAKWLEQLRRDLWRLRRAWDEGYFDYNFADACTAYGQCIFMDMCRSESPESWANDFEVNRWNPLHKNPIEDTRA